MNTYPEYNQNLYSSPPSWVDCLTPELRATALHLAEMAAKSGLTRGCDALAYARLWTRFSLCFSLDERNHREQFRIALMRAPAAASAWFASQLAPARRQHASRRCGKGRAN